MELSYASTHVFKAACSVTVLSYTLCRLDARSKNEAHLYHN